MLLRGVEAKLWVIRSYYSRSAAWAGDIVTIVGRFWTQLARDPGRWHSKSSKGITRVMDDEKEEIMYNV